MTEFNPIYLTETEHAALDHTGTPGVQSGASAWVTRIIYTWAVTAEVGDAIFADPAGLVVDGDGDMSAGSPILSSATGGFTQGLVGATISDGSGYQVIPPGTIVLSVQDTNTLTMSANATDTSEAQDDVKIGGTFHVTFPAPVDGGQVIVVPCVPANDAITFTGNFYDAELTDDLAPFAGAQFLSDGRSWYVLNA